MRELVVVLEVSFSQLSEVHVRGDVLESWEYEWIFICLMLVIASERAGATGGGVVGAVRVSVVDGDGAGTF